MALQAMQETKALFCDDGVVSWFFLDCGASVGFFTRYDGELREPLVWRQGSHVSYESGQGEGVIALESQERNRTSRRVEEGL